MEYNKIDTTKSLGISNRILGKNRIRKSLFETPVNKEQQKSINGEQLVQKYTSQTHYIDHKM